MYTYVSIRKLKEVHELTHPGSRLGRRAGAEATPAAPPMSEEAAPATVAAVGDDDAAELLHSLAAEAEEEDRV